jgi:hypothetical protein
MPAQCEQVEMVQLFQVIEERIGNGVSGTPCPMTISSTAILVALGFSGSVGTFFGYCPAR